jgi:succinate dehydrogenase/fumarate reductase flavoprotein subunit
MADYWSDYQETVTATESSTDEDNGKIRTASDLKKLEERAFSKDPARAHRQLVNAMKQYVKRFLDDCKAPEDKLKRLTKVYRNAASLHEFIVNIIAEKYKRLDARSSRNRL